MKKIIELNDFFITKINIEWASSIPDIEKNPYIDYEILRNPKNDREFGMRLYVRAQTKSESNKERLNIEAGILGFFSFFEGVDEKDKQIMIRLNGATILYGLLRGHLTSILGAFPCGHFVLPSLYMSEIIPEIEERKNKALSKKTMKRTRTTSPKKTPEKKIN
jgi:preprotein translocase subunit SecB